MQQEVCEICKGNDYIIDEDNHVQQCPECTLNGKIYEPQEVENVYR